MTTLDILYLTLSLGVACLVGVVGYVAYHLVQTLKIAQFIMSDLEGVTADISKLRYITKSGVWGLAYKILQPFSRKEVTI